MSQADKARRFSAMHQKGNPVVLYNIWDAGGAKALVHAGAPAIATGSWSVAAAHGYEDGEAIPLDLVLTIVSGICAAVDVPVTVDFEGGYAVGREEVAENVRKVIQAGAIGINFEDRVVGGKGLFPIAEQTARIAAIKAMAEQEGIPLMLNARTDLFLGTDPEAHAGLVAEALGREAAYAAAGADCFFVPGLTDAALISDVVAVATLPVNVMLIGALDSIEHVAALGVSRVSFGPAPFLAARLDIQERYSSLS